MKLKKREQRRAQTFDYGVRVRKLHLEKVHPDGNIDCICEQSVWFFRKRKVDPCSCHKRKHGQPKRSVGLCYDLGGPRKYMKVRIAGNRLVKHWKKLIDAGIDPDDIDL